ncbi:hypothetical protein diail_4951 [Diaporthe ilicicola]|nr:hypothetical protein diail_4951 [Diaporthe ilicicola]
MRILGCEHIHHASEDDDDDDSWDRIAEAARATFPIFHRGMSGKRPPGGRQGRLGPRLWRVPGPAQWLASIDTVFISPIIEPHRKLIYGFIVKPIRELHF